MNGDGYADVIVGAPDYDNGQADEGRAFVYHGSARPGLSGTPRPGRPRATRPAPSFGWSVGTAGDVNGDGYADVIVGARDLRQRPDATRARAFVYHGAAAGPERRRRPGRPRATRRAPSSATRSGRRAT